MTALTASVNRAYEIAGLYREKGITTVIGGIHVSVLPEEALNYADAVVIGDAESVWEELLDDFSRKNLKRIYNKPLENLINLPRPNHSVFDKRYWFSSIQTSRGCPMNCSFCSVQAIYHGKYMVRPVNEILDEIETVPNKVIAFIDDNLVGNSIDRSEIIYGLLNGMIDRKMNKFWWSHASMDVAFNEKFLKLAAKSGCKMLFIGVEADDDEALKEVNKKINLKINSDKYRQAFKNIQKYGISIMGSLIYGLDSDNIEKLKKRTSFIKRSRIDSLLILPLIPFPATRVFDNLKKENRLLKDNFPSDWNFYDGLEVVYVPKQMEVNDFSAFMTKQNSKIYNHFSVFLRFLRSCVYLKSVSSAKWALNINRNYGDFLLRRNLKK